MAMLAGPRRKQRVLNLRGDSAWSKDSSKFGQRMLERMGWAPGKGLGAREDGVTAHVVARYKNDDHGLGYNDRNDQWTRHEDSFESLLAGLRSEETAAPLERMPASLEQKSKKSRARVHYHKFTRGKDITQYSKKDLASIFGKKSLINKDAKINTDEVQHIRKSEDNDKDHQQQVFKCGGNMADYFTSKLQTRGCSELSTMGPSLSESITLQDHTQKVILDNFDYQPQKKKKKKRSEGKDNAQNSMVSQQEASETERKVDFVKKKKKKKKMCDSEKHFENSVKDEYDLLKKKRTESEINVQNSVIISQQEHTIKEDNHINKKKKKKCDSDKHFENSVKDESDLFDCRDNKRYKKNIF